MNDAPFDVTKIQENIETSLTAPYDPVRAGAGLRRKEGGNGGRDNRAGSTSGPKDNSQVVQAEGTIEAILAARQGTHGDFTDNAQVSQALKFIMRDTAGWDRITAVQAEALHMIVHKIGRILSGNPNVKDHWDDIAGYAKLASERIGQ